MQNSSSAWQDKWKIDVPGHNEIQQLHELLREGTMQRWNRAVPFADELFDRWEQAAFLGFGKGSNIYNSSLVIGDVEVGEETWIGPFTVLDGSGGLKIGSYCHIGSGVQIYTHDSSHWVLTKGKVPYRYEPSTINDCCYVGGMSIFAPGVTVGDHCIIGANSFVTRDVPSYSIAAGTPAKVLGRIEITKESEVHFIYDSA